MDACGKSQLLEYYVQELLSTQPQGVIINGVPQSQASVDLTARVLSEEGIPLVLLYCEPSMEACKQGKVSWVSPLNEDMIQYACNVLIERGHMDIGMVVQSSGHSRPWSITGYQRATTRAGLRYRPEYIVWGLDYFGSPGRIGDVLKSPSQREVLELVENPRVTSIITTSPIATLQVITAMRQIGLSWPEDKSIVSVGFNEWLQYTIHPPMTNIPLPTDMIGRKATELLMSMCPMFGGRDQGHGVFVGEYVVENLVSGSVKSISPAHK